MEKANSLRISCLAVFLGVSFVLAMVLTSWIPVSAFNLFEIEQTTKAPPTEVTLTFCMQSGKRTF